MNKIIDFVKPYVFITVGLFIFAFGWTAFLIPSEIIGGGISGLSSLIYFATGFEVGYSNLLVNIVLVLIAIRILGAHFGINTIYGILVSSFFFIILQEHIHKPLVNDAFMAALIGGGLSGVGVGIAFMHGGNAGGTDIIALIINKYKNISPGRVFLYIDAVVIASSWFLFHDVEKIVYGYVVMAVASYSIDLVLDGSKQSFQIMIYSRYSKIIAERISEEVGRGVTCLKAYGWYSKKDIEVVMVIARKMDKQHILKIVQDTDDRAFISVAKVMGVFGQNFEEIRL